MINFFMIDDHPGMIEGVEFHFSYPDHDIKMVGYALNMEDALRQLPSLKVDVILLDLFLKTDPSPFDNYLRIIRILPGIPVAIYTAESSLWWKYNMFRLGVNAYITKTQDIDILATILPKIIDGSTFLTSDVKPMLDPGFTNDSPVFISSEELEIAKMISTGKSIKSVAESMNKSTSSVEKSLKSLREKIDAHSNPDMTRIMIDLGYIPPSRQG